MTSADTQQAWEELSPAHHLCLEIGTLLDEFDLNLLQASVDDPLEPVVDALLRRGWLETAGEGYAVAPAIRAYVREMLQAAPDRLQEAYARGSAALATRLAGDPADEAKYIRHLQAWCELLLRQAPASLAATAGAVPLDRLREPENRQLARYYRGLGEGLIDRFAAARAIFAELKGEPGLPPLIRGRTLNSDATFARYIGDYGGAFEGYRASFEVWEALGERLRQGHVLLNEGSLHYHLQNYELAEKCLRGSVAVFEAEGALYPQALASINLGLVERDRGRWEPALAQFTHAASILETEGAQDFLGRIANNIGEVEMLRGNFPAAVEQLNRALSLMSTRIYRVDVYLNLGLVYQARDDQASALIYYQQALDLALELGRVEIVALVRYRIGVAHAASGRPAEARDHYAQAIDVIEQTRAPIRDEGVRISLMGRWQQIYESMVLLCLQLDDPEAAFNYAERARARAFADLLFQSPDLAAEESASQGVSTATAAMIRERLDGGTLVLAYLATGLRAPDSPLLDAIPPAAQALRECLVTPAQLWLFALGATGLEAHRCGIDPNALHGSALAVDGRRFLQPAILRRLYDTLIAPATPRLQSATHAVIVPHGPLHQVPFAALLDKDNQPWLDGGAHLAYAPSATLLLHHLAGPSSAAPKPCLALGYDGPAERDLRHTEAEAAAIAGLCGGESWIGGRPVIERLRAASADYRWVHIACHGEFDTEDPLASWVLVGPDERLRGSEILASLRFDADLVALSACYSGVSRVLRGDEPMGLVRALLGSGARAVLATQWPVEDTSARLLMECFYRRLLAAPGAADLPATLRAAQQELRALTAEDARARLGGLDERLAQTGNPYADPFFWAAYVVIQ